MSQETHLNLPGRLALVDDDLEYSEFLAQHLQALGVAVQRFADSNDLLTCDTPFGFDFYVVDLMLPGIDGVDLIRLLRRRTQAGIVVVSGRATPDVFAAVVDVGADMYVAKPVSFEQIVVAVHAVHRRVGRPLAAAWKLDRRARQLQAPDGAQVQLSDTDQTVMQCLLDARGDTVSRELLCQALGYGSTAEAENLLSATIYRLRRRIERATPLPVPLQTQARAGYIFRDALISD